MKLSEMKRTAEARTKGEWHIGHINESLDRGEIENNEGIVIASDCKRNDEPFIVMAANNWDKLMAVVDAANDFIDNIFVMRLTEPEQKLKDALKTLEQE